MKYAWTTDCHLDHIDDDDRLRAFSESLVVNDPSGIIITGDISNAQRLVYHLSVIERVVQRPVFFVCGNHDYYTSSIAEVRKQLHSLTNMSQYLRYLPTIPFMTLNPSTALVGHDGWYDGLNGRPHSNQFLLNDWVQTKEFHQASGGRQYVGMMRDVKDRKLLLEVCRKLANEGVQHMADGIKAATRHHKAIVVATHVPPFPETHIFEGAIGDQYAQPWFTSKMCGDMLLAAAAAYPNVQFTVLAGHTHGQFDGMIKPNLKVRVGAADYGRPGVCGYVEV